MHYARVKNQGVRHGYGGIHKPRGHIFDTPFVIVENRRHLPNPSKTSLKIQLALKTFLSTLTGPSS